MKHKRLSKLRISCIFVIIISTVLLAVFYSRGGLFKNNNLEKLTTKNVSLYPLNKNGQTYGPHIDNYEEEPDLIEVYGTHGTLGYIKSTDLESPPNTPEEAIKQQNNRKTPIELPVYDKDGENIISTFVLQDNTGVDY
ncbi:hypothetical protein [Cellulosilyticum sp. I15G10I2]|uniref:hypothetical protein n=1 Tax=Cellulosilyticum sp. I15G10I2 TaxID=1892843 RepID=UPI00085BD90E|nr:hypothetical protein [Cellulosilyticum sp. I15G10I2]